MKYFIILIFILPFSRKPDLQKHGVIDSFQTGGQSFIQNPVELVGLEQLYFQRAEREESIRQNLSNVLSLLPARLAEPEFTDLRNYTAEDVYQVTVHDFIIPFKESRLWLREVIDCSHPRISKLWWVVYDNGRRSDIWFFTAYPERNDNKLLPNYKIDSVFVNAEGFVAIQVDGSMFRPGGFWTVKGIKLLFSLENSRLALDRVLNVFSFLQGYGGSDSLEVNTEQVVQDRIERRTFVPATERILYECNLGDLMSDEGWHYAWEELKQGAFCITCKQETKISYREFNEPSFIERGWKSDKK
jgi:hypothetical protein